MGFTDEEISNRTKKIDDVLIDVNKKFEQYNMKFKSLDPRISGKMRYLDYDGLSYLNNNQVRMKRKLRHSQSCNILHLIIKKLKDGLSSLMNSLNYNVNIV
jgi:hypothetical protein